VTDTINTQATLSIAEQRAARATLWSDLRATRSAWQAASAASLALETAEMRSALARKKRAAAVYAAARSRFAAGAFKRTIYPPPAPSPPRPAPALTAEEQAAKAISLKAAWAAMGGRRLTEAEMSEAKELNDLRSQRSAGGMRPPAEGLLWIRSR